MNLFTGKIIFWNGIYGFISNDVESVFFHHSALVDKNIHLLENVIFNIELNKFGIHKGEKIATHIQLTGEKINLNEYNRFVGILQNWDQKQGVISSPQQKLPIHFFNTRKLYLDDKFKTNDLVVFYTVESTKHDNTLFALFAYNINRENDIEFLQKQYIDSGIEQINLYIDELANTKVLSYDEKFILKLTRLLSFENQVSYTSLVNLLKVYSYTNQLLVYDVLRTKCNNAYLIQLFEDGIIENYDIELMKTYFHNSLADNKRNLITRFQQSDKDIILKYHIDLLRNKGELEFLNDELKTVLDIVCRNPQTKNDEIYSELKEELLCKLSSDELITLWLSEYINELSEAFVVAEFDIRNSKQLKILIDKEDDKFVKVRKKLFENYFANFKNKNFEKELGPLIQILQEFERSSSGRYAEVISIYNSVFDNYQKFLLWIFGVKQIEFNISEIIKYHQPINDYYKLKYLQNCRSENRINSSHIFEDEISYEGLVAFIKTNPWNEFIYPFANNEEEYRNINSFISDVELFVENDSINVYHLANEIFESMPKYNTHHIRLWLYTWVDNDKYDYVGFKYGFKGLTKEEQKVFRERGDKLIKGEVFNKISNEIKPCIKIIETTKLYKVYLAYLYNIFFQEGYLTLKKEDGTYTMIYKDEQSSRAFNEIPESNRLNKQEIKVTVDNNNIITKIVGLDLIFNTIHTYQIEKVLGMPIETESNAFTKNNNYVEDWELNKKIKDFLYAGQVAHMEVKLVKEPKNFYRRLDDDSGIDKFELTALFTHKVPQDFGIVWENVDYSQDRAIYVFKAKYIELESQLMKISESISKTAQFRSTLISSEKDEMHELFRDDLGYVGCIRKNKGELYSFDKFLLKLERLFWQQTPVLPTIEEKLKFENWNPETPHSVKVKSLSSSSKQTKPRQMQDYEIGKVDIPFFEKSDLKVEKIPYEKKIRIYNMLKSFNEELQKTYRKE